MFIGFSFFVFAFFLCSLPEPASPGSLASVCRPVSPGMRAHESRCPGLDNAPIKIHNIYRENK
ncbi:hypothetical protein BFAG_04265 [Bacteroides fragilis 3_1_12]|uniref:Secreted protein n=1 Tax=Bacteroides fragilis 3_1_12 TaxID=457424 RepID=A0ABN0BRQ9_BACFG|nr:hypothetical protein BFAG_04265 [Bacteroides fragilis 3_1_12]